MFPAVFHVISAMDVEALPFQPVKFFKNDPQAHLRLHVYHNRETHECTTDSAQYIAARNLEWDSCSRVAKAKKDGCPIAEEIQRNPWAEIVLTPEQVETLRELIAKNWVCLANRATGHATSAAS